MSDSTPSDWTPEQRALFSRLFRHMADNQAVLTHTEAAPIHPDHWCTIAWNAAWMATHMAGPNGDSPLEHVDEHGNTLAIEVPLGAAS